MRNDFSDTSQAFASQTYQPNDQEMEAQYLHVEQISATQVDYPDNQQPGARYSRIAHIFATRMRRPQAYRNIVDAVNRELNLLILDEYWVSAFIPDGSQIPTYKIIPDARIDVSQKEEEVKSYRAILQASEKPRRQRFAAIDNALSGIRYCRSTLSEMERTSDDQPSKIGRSLWSDSSSDCESHSATLQRATPARNPDQTELISELVSISVQQTSDSNDSDDGYPTSREKSELGNDTNKGNTIRPQWRKFDLDDSIPFMPIDESHISEASLKTAPRVSGAHPQYYSEESSHSGSPVQWPIQHLDDLESKKGKYICFLKMKRDTVSQGIEDITFYPPDDEKAAAKYIQDWFITPKMALLSVVREFGLALSKHNYIGKEAISVKNQPTGFKKLESIMRASESAILTMERRQEAAQHDIS